MKVLPLIFFVALSFQVNAQQISIKGKRLMTTKYFCRTLNTQK